jgi:hypothetical protein
MIHWDYITSFASACKYLKYMSYEEYEEIRKTKSPEKIEEKAQKYNVEPVKVAWLNDACRHLRRMRCRDFGCKGKLDKKLKVKQIRLDGGLLENHLLDDEGNTKKLICGYPVKGAPKGYVCTHVAGAGTNHLHYGLCRMHETMDRNPENREKFWNALRAIHKVNTISEVLNNTQAIEETSRKNMDSDIVYLEMARQMIMKKMEIFEAELIPKDFIESLTMISESIAKVKSWKSKVEAMNFIPPEQVNIIILRVLDAVTKGEDKDVVMRIAERARHIGDLVIPGVVYEETDNKQVAYERESIVKAALYKATKYVEGGTSALMTPETTGYVEDMPQNNRVPFYKLKNIRRKRGAGISESEIPEA